MSAPRSVRRWEVDAARTVAIAMMVTYHAAYDVDFLAPSVGLNPFDGGWRALQVATGSSFLALVGVSAAIAVGRARAAGLAWSDVYRRRARRAGEVLAAALLVSAATFLALGDDYVRFGILHCIGVAMLLAPPLVRLGAWNLLLAAAVVPAGLWLADERADTAALAVVGLRPETGTLGVDYYPLLPWLGPFLIGLALGAVLYPDGRRGAWARRWPATTPALQAAGAPGRAALPIYLVHQLLLIPIVAGVLLLAGVELELSGFR